MVSKRFASILLLLLLSASASYASIGNTSPSIVNVINFVRGVEPRYDSDLCGTLAKEIDLVHSSGLPATWLVQYDALTDPRFLRVLRTLDANQEVGGWFEVVQPMVEKAGLKWRGRYSWDWFANVDLMIGYTPAEREKLVDVYMAEFKRAFGRYPRSVGAWLMDAHTLAYLADKYGVAASCNCKDQYGTDGYTLWGGYYNQAYYPSRSNAFVPAESKSKQIDIPIFRMLGSDPIYQYDVDYGDWTSEVITLEPACKEGGHNPEWVDWFFRTNFQSPSISFAYAQVGQENSFSWERMKNGLTYQLAKLKELSDKGAIRVETLEQSGKWFKEKYKTTPASAVTALEDWKNEGRKSIWYSSRFYRTNLYWEGNVFRIRDIHYFNEEYKERYLSDTCTTENCTYDTLPVIDGLLWSSKDKKAGIRIFRVSRKGEITYVPAGDPQVTSKGDSLVVRCSDKTEILCRPNEICVSHPSARGANWGLEISWSDQKKTDISSIRDDSIWYTYNGFKYALRCTGGRLSRDGASIRIEAHSNKIRLSFRNSVPSSR